MYCNSEFLEEIQSKLESVCGKRLLEEVMTTVRQVTHRYNIELVESQEIKDDDRSSQALHEFLFTKEIAGLSKNTLSQYSYACSDFLSWLSAPLSNVTAQDVRNYLYQLDHRSHMSSRSLDNRRSILSSFFSWMHDEGIIPTNPLKKVSKIKYEVKPREPLTDVELASIRAACANIREKALVETLYSTGCRISELANLDISDVDFISREVKLLGKGNKHRVSYLNGAAFVDLQDYLRSRTDENPALFVGMIAPHNRLTAQTLEEIISKLGKRAGIRKHLHPHLFRHTLATDAINRGMPVEEVQGILGHVDINTTMIYTKLSKSSTKYHHSCYVV